MIMTRNLVGLLLMRCWHFHFMYWRRDNLAWEFCAKANNSILQWIDGMQNISYFTLKVSLQEQGKFLCTIKMIKPGVTELIILNILYKLLM